MKFLYVRMSGGKASVKLMDEIKLNMLVHPEGVIQRSTKWAETATPGDVFFLTGGMICAVNDSVDDLRPM